LRLGGAKSSSECDMRGWLRHLELTAKSKTGLFGEVIIERI
jgi:hypothetical protein